MTSTATSTGAMPFRALTKMRPKMPIPVQPGSVRPSTAPIVRPMAILSKRLTEVYLSSNFLAMFMAFYCLFSVLSNRMMRTGLSLPSCMWLQRFVIPVSRKPHFSITLPEAVFPGK